MKPSRYRLSVSRFFPAYHNLKWDDTNFIEKIESGEKIHTIRGNYELWRKRFDKIEKGEAVLELYYHSGKPYHSKQITFKTLTRDDGIGLQSIIPHLKSKNEMLINDFFEILTFETNENGHDSITHRNVFKINDLANNDGLSFPDFQEWFKKADLSKPMALIHFTAYRY